MKTHLYALALIAIEISRNTYNKADIGPLLWLRVHFSQPLRVRGYSSFEAAWNKSCCCDASGAPCFARQVVAK